VEKLGLKRGNASGAPSRDVQDPIETKIHPRRKRRMQSSSQAGESSSTQSLMYRVRGNPGTYRDGNAEGQRAGKPSGETHRATLKASRRRSRESYEPGRPGELNLGTAGRSRRSGEIWKESIKSVIERGNGATRRFKHGSVEGRTIRGNSMIRRSA